MASSKKATTPALDALRKMRPKSTPAPAAVRAPAGISPGGAAGVEDEEQRFTMRIPAEDQELLRPFRTFLMENKRKVIDGRIFLTAIRRVQLDAAFLAAYDELAQRDGRSLRKLRAG